MERWDHYYIITHSARPSRYLHQLSSWLQSKQHTDPGEKNTDTQDRAFHAVLGGGQPEHHLIIIKATTSCCWINYTITRRKTLHLIKAKNNHWLFFLFFLKRNVYLQWQRGSSAVPWSCSTDISFWTESSSSGITKLQNRSLCTCNFFPEERVLWGHLTIFKNGLHWMSSGHFLRMKGWLYMWSWRRFCCWITARNIFKHSLFVNKV